MDEMDEVFMPDASRRRSQGPSSLGILLVAILFLTSLRQAAMGQDDPHASKTEGGHAAADHAEPGKPKSNPQDAVRAALIRNAIVGSGRRSELILRELNVRCGVPKADVEKLREALNQAIGAWIEAHTSGDSVQELDFYAILESQKVIEAFEK